MAAVIKIQEVTNVQEVVRCPTCTRVNGVALEDVELDLARLRRQLETLQEVVDRLTENDKPLPSQIGKSTEAKDTKTTVSRVKYVVSKINETGQRVETSGNPPNPSKNTVSETEFAFEAKEFFEEKGKSTSQIILTSPPLRQLVYSVLKKYFEHSKDTQWAEREPSLSVLKAPFTPLLSYWKELTKEANLLETDSVVREGREELKILLQHVRDLQPELVLQIESLQESKRVTRQHLDVLFRPGTLVVSHPDPDHPQVFKVHNLVTLKLSGDDDDSDASDDSDDGGDGKTAEEKFVLKCWTYDWKGTKLARVYFNFTIKGFMDEKEVKDLPCYPVRYYEDSDGRNGFEALESRLIKRGKKFREICTKEPGATSMCLCKGRILELQRSFRRYMPTNAKRDWNIRQSLVFEPIMVDFESFLLESRERLLVGKLKPKPNINPCNCQLCVGIEDEKWISKFSDLPLETENGGDNELDQNYILLPPRVVGFAFKTGYFAQFYVDDVETVLDENPGLEFDDRLIFPEDKEENKAEIKRLILGHKSDERVSTIGSRPLISDAVEGKGKGLVILLHGPPGVGKTLTAELAAKAAGRPLYKVGASDIGLHPEEAERNFSRLFRLASKWQAVLLIDEAEVFLDIRGPRGTSDVEKNALVSVLLRALEYFPGVLMMTTNRVMTIDPAMVSRIHYALALGALDKEQEARIWKSYTKQLKPENCNEISKIKDWVGLKTKKKISEMNGRQIRNLFTTAQALAEGELAEGCADSTGKVQLEHIKRINETMTTFRDDMQGLLIWAKADAAKSSN